MRSTQAALDDFDDFVVDLPLGEQRDQASRCMNCGVPFCLSIMEFNGARQSSGCPLHNLIPETNDLLFRGRMRQAAQRLSLTNPFPEFTGRVCPAPCETACNLGLNQEPVTIHDNERAISDWTWEQGMKPFGAASADAPLVSIVGSGPAGLAAAWELARQGLRVRVYERDDRPGGLLMYGIPNMKLPKEVVLRRVRLMEQSGIEFTCGTDAVECADEIKDGSDAIIVACGAREARRLEIPGADLHGVHYAVEYLAEATKSLLDGRSAAVDASGKDVVVIGGGETGTDCLATALRQGALSVTQVIRAQRPPQASDAPHAWPAPRAALTLGYGQREARDIFGTDPRLWATDTIAFESADGLVSGVRVLNASGEHVIPAQIVLIAKGFTGAEQRVLDAFTAEDGMPVFIAGDAATGPSIVASAIASGLKAANAAFALLNN